jgi:hypothetical protein
MWGKQRRLPSSPANLIVLPVLDQVIDDARIGQRRGVAQREEIVLGDLAQDAAHDLARAGLGQARRPGSVRRGDRADLGAHMLDQFLAQLVGRLLALHQRDIA